MVVFDTESNGFVEKATRIWCASFYDTVKKDWKIFLPHEVDQIPEYLNSIPELCGHNILGHDLPLIKKLYGYDYKGKAVDTLLYSRVLWSDIEAVSYVDKEVEVITPAILDDEGEVIEKEIITLKKIYKSIKERHSLASWGVRLGVAKPSHENWHEFSAEMLERNKKDTEITALLHEKCIDYMRSLQEKDPRLNNWDAIFRMETYFWQIMNQAEENGWMVDTDLLFQLEADFTQQLTAIDKELQSVLPIRVVKTHGEGVCKAFRADGKPTANAIKWLGPDSLSEISGDFCRVKFEPTNPGSHEQIKDFLLANGWEPLEYNIKKDKKFKKPIRDEHGKNIKTSPKKPKTEEDWDLIANNLQAPAIQHLAKRAKIVHRLGLVQGFIKAMRSDKRVPSEMNTVGAVTQRVTHRVIANIPRAQEGTFYGKEMRSIFTCPSDRVIVGCDAAGLEVRCEAHYTYPFDKAAAMELIEGDPHTKNATAWDVNRNTAKSGKYALLYGCGKPKLAATLGKPLSQAEALYEAYWLANPAAKRLKIALETQWEKHGYIVSIDGRPLMVRYKHALLNTLLQSCGAILMKIAACFAAKEIENRKLDVLILCFYHDEYNFECFPRDAEEVSEIAINSIAKAGEYLKMNVPFTGEAHTGSNWAMIH